MAKIRTISQCMAEIKKLDCDSSISEWKIRKLVKENEVKHFMSGNKALVDLNDLLKYFGYIESEVQHVC